MTGNPDTFFFFKARLLLKIFIYLFIAVLGLCCCLGFSLVAAIGAILHCDAWASHCDNLSSGRAQALGPMGFSSCGTWTQSLQSWALRHRLNSCGTEAELLRGMWDLPGPGIKPVSCTLGGGFLSTVPPGKFPALSFKYSVWCNVTRYL